jgi:hypothetical protein
MTNVKKLLLATTVISATVVTATAEQSWTVRPPLVPIAVSAEPPKLEISSLMGVFTIVNYGSQITIVNVTINDRTECVSEPSVLSLEETMGLRVVEQIFKNTLMRDGLFAKEVLSNEIDSGIKQGIMKGKKQWRKNTVLQLGESLAVENKCQGEILKVKVETDRGDKYYTK